MDAGSSDVRKVLAFGREKLARKILLFCFVAAAVGMLALVVPDDDGRLRIAGWVLVVIGVGLGAYELSKVTLPKKPLLVLSPKGIDMSVEGATEFHIPWSEVRGVDAVHVDGPRGTTFEDVTAVAVSREFYDRVIHVDSFIRQGPGWDATFIPRGPEMLVAFHPTILPIAPDDLLAAVEARYRAFGRPPAPAAEAGVTSPSPGRSPS